MGTQGIGEGHEKTATGATWQSDGLRDTDVLTSAPLTNFVERGLCNGVVPITMTQYQLDSGATDRNHPFTGNCSVRKNTGGTKSFFVDAGVVCLDGMFYNVGSASSLDIDDSNLYYARFNAGWTAASLPNSANEECWVLVIADPELNQNGLSLVCGQKVNVSSGLYPQMPSSHLVKQSVVLAAIRVTNGPVVTAVEDKRVFVGAGPLPLTKLQDASGAAYPHNNMAASPAITSANLPITGLGLMFTRDPAGHSASVQAVDPAQQHGAGQTHLFYQTDQGVGAGHAHQLTPVHRQHKQGFNYTGPGVHGTAFEFTPLVNEINPTKHLVSAVWFSTNSAQSVNLVEGIHFTIAGTALTMLDLATTATNPHTSAGVAATGYVLFTYTHSGY